MSSIHSRIKTRRLALGLTQDALAAKLGVTYQSVQQWETEPSDDPTMPSTAPRRTRLAAVATALETTPGWLLYGFDDGSKTTTEDEAQLVLLYRGMTPELQAIMRQQAQSYYQISARTEDAPPPADDESDDP